jgi:UDP-3-O-[3-hydroxymyristoyl] glucosamine N-acyltransferase
MRPSVPVVLAATLALLLATPARAGDCNVEAGPNDRVSRGEPLVVRSGERVENAIALHGDLTVEPGAVVDKAVAIGGTLTLRSGSRVKEDAVAIGGDLVVERDARVGNDAVSLGGQVLEAQGARIEGSVVGLAIQGGKSSLARALLKGITSLDSCTVIQKRGT